MKVSVKVFRLFSGVKVAVGAVQVTAVVDADAGSGYHLKLLFFFDLFRSFIRPSSRYSLYLSS